MIACVRVGCGVLTCIAMQPLSYPTRMWFNYTYKQEDDGLRFYNHHQVVSHFTSRITRRVLSFATTLP